MVEPIPVNVVLPAEIQASTTKKSYKMKRNLFFVVLPAEIQASTTGEKRAEAKDHKVVLPAEIQASTTPVLSQEFLSYYMSFYLLKYRHLQQFNN